MEQKTGNEILEKLIQAKTLEKEALLLLLHAGMPKSILPEGMQKHMAVIQAELKTMLYETVMEAAGKGTEGQKTASGDGIKKVDIT